MDGCDIYGSVLDSTCVPSTNQSVNCVSHEYAIKKGQYLEGTDIIIYHPKGLHCCRDRLVQVNNLISET